MSEQHDGEQDAVWYFGYGSNMSPAIFVGRRQMHPLATRWGWLAGYQLCFNIPVGPGERGVANIEAAAGARICGVAYLLTHGECARLDRTEGVHVGLYHRIPVALQVDDDRLAAFTYQSRMIQDGRKPSPRYLGLLLDGARHHGLPPDYVAYLESFELAWDERETERR